MPKHDDISDNTGHRCSTIQTENGPRLMVWDDKHSMIGTWAQAFGQGPLPRITTYPS